MRFTFPILLLFCASIGHCLNPHPARAAFVLDDFDDPVEVVSPGMLDDTITTEDVGHLSATRELRIAATASGPRSPLASLSISTGTMTAKLDKMGTTIDGRPANFAFQFNYIFAPTDVSQGGANDAMLFDFQTISGMASPIFLRAIVTDDTNKRARFEAGILDVPTNSGAFTAIMPFSIFTFRGGFPGSRGTPDFTTFKRINFEFLFYLLVWTLSGL